MTLASVFGHDKQWIMCHGESHNICDSPWQK